MTGKLTPANNFYIVYANNPTYVKDYTGFNQYALAFTDIFTGVLNDGNITSESIAALIVEEILEIFLEVEIMRGVLSDDSILLDGEEIISDTLRKHKRLEAIVQDLITIIRNERTEQEVAQECYEDAWGSNPISQTDHYNRNSNQGLLTLYDVQNTYSFNFTNYGETATHNIYTSGNQDYRGNPFTQHYGWQLIFDSIGNQVTYYNDAKNMGTYDFAPPTNPWNWFGDKFGDGSHITMDITPWLVWGNAPQPTDPTTPKTRLVALYEECYQYSEMHVCLSYNKSYLQCLFQ